jgi:hypothetical protein
VIDYDTTIDYAISEGVQVIDGSNSDPPTIADIVKEALNRAGIYDSWI